MGDSLRDQLLKVGLVNEKQIKKAQQEKRKKTKPRRKKKTVEEIDQNKQQIQEQLAQKIAYDRELNEKLNAKIKRKEIAAQIKQLIENHRLPKEEGDIAYHFSDGKKVKRLFVTKEVQNKLNRGMLGIIKLGDQYEFLPKEIVEKIRHRDASRITLYHDTTSQKDDPDDPYAAYQVPDDLEW